MDEFEGKTTIAPEVLLTIARLASTQVAGVSRLVSAPPSNMSRLIKGRQRAEGIGLEIIDDAAYVDIYVVLKNEVNVREISRNIQREVSRAITEMVGMTVGRVNVHIEDIDYPVEAAT